MTDKQDITGKVIDLTSAFARSAAGKMTLNETTIAALLRGAAISLVFARLGARNANMDDVARVLEKATEDARAEIERMRGLSLDDRKEMARKAVQKACGLTDAEADALGKTKQ
jgi:hypothetical protein